MMISRRSLFPAMLCLVLTIPAPAQQRTIGVPTDSSDVDFAVVRQGPSFQTRLTDRPQKVLFVKSQAANAKAAIGNLLLSDVGLNLITMALAPEMKMWNPYMNDSIRKGID